MKKLVAKLTPKFYKGEDSNPFMDDVTKGYFWQMEKEYIKDGVVAPLAVAIGSSALRSEKEDGSEQFDKAKVICEDNAESFEQLIFSLFMAASYHDEEEIGWKAYFE